VEMISYCEQMSRGPGVAFPGCGGPRSGRVGSAVLVVDFSCVGKYIALLVSPLEFSERRCAI